MARYLITLVAEGELSFSVDLPTIDPYDVSEEFMTKVFSHALRWSWSTQGRFKKQMIKVPQRCLVEDWCDLAAVLADDGILVTKTGEEVQALENYVGWRLEEVEQEPVYTIDKSRYLGS